MAKSPQSKGPISNQHDTVGAMSNVQAVGLGTLNWFGASTIERMSDMGAEWMTFVAERVREDVALQHSILHAKTPDELQNAQMAFLQKAMDQYAAETGKMIELSSKLFETSEDDEGPSDNVNV
ncbi:phasin family protein [uncultured Tateyamaria sp.]|uniref:phasin family protein n=1 Tax=uncultured Tateyamaria sp. TaxID=455651 RepID=UPI00262B778A|nr:phasin family protein [uncultured Tateyamaria sp.]